jgi:hypothetical protein
MNNQALASKRTVNQTIELVNNSPASLFSKDDVVKLLTSLETTAAPITSEMIDRLMDLIEDGIRNVDPEDMIDKSTAEFSLDGNQIELDGVDVDTSYIVDEVGSVVNHWYSVNFS